MPGVHMEINVLRPIETVANRMMIGSAANKKTREGPR
ncbi:hypothetical protein IWQ55_002707 [Labrenzia sp. EL_208]|nr:hypothetical protein [Labrenzia sp. EL_142]MBG6174882.1 hypothetical protein [Labrenzia sp. EL_132]MBG6229494.1 hypothetical protein [Labrenzia sp. EL_208]